MTNPTSNLRSLTPHAKWLREASDMAGKMHNPTLALTCLQAALAIERVLRAVETTPEPVAWMTDEENPRVVKDETRARMSGTTRDACCIPLYRSPPEEPAREHLHWCAVNIGKDCNCWCDHPRSELLARKGDAFEMRKCLECTKIFRVRLRTPQGEPALTPPQELPGMREPVVIAPQGNAGESPASLPEKASDDSWWCSCGMVNGPVRLACWACKLDRPALNGDGGS